MNFCPPPCTTFSRKNVNLTLNSDIQTVRLWIASEYKSEEYVGIQTKLSSRSIQKNYPIPSAKKVNWSILSSKNNWILRNTEVTRPFSNSRWESNQIHKIKLILRALHTWMSYWTLHKYSGRVQQGSSTKLNKLLIFFMHHFALLFNSLIKYMTFFFCRFIQILHQRGTGYSSIFRSKSSWI